jgi:hypothetical protein
MAIADPPPLSISRTTAWAASAFFTYVRQTVNPRVAARRDVAAPIPRLPPVTMTVFDLGSSIRAGVRLQLSRRRNGSTRRPMVVFILRSGSAPISWRDGDRSLTHRTTLHVERT